jgi:uridine kinase
MSQSYIIGVAGGSGSGKSTVARTIIEAMLPGSCAIIDHDSYYRDFSHLNFEERAALNFDHPDALETSLLASHLDELRAGRSFEKPVYDFRTHTRTSVTSTVAPARTVVVEGILVLASPELRARFDLMIFVETDADIRLMRRMRRDMVERGRSFLDVRDQYFATVRPMHEQFVEPSKRHANILLPEGGQNTVGINLITQALLFRAHPRNVSDL